MKVSQQELEIRKRLKNDFEFYAYSCLKIASKQSAGASNASSGLTRFKLNAAQKYVHAKLEEQKKRTGKVRAIILKGRQQGVSTLVGGRFYWLSTHNFGVQAFILTHHETATDNLFTMVKRYNDNCLPELKPELKLSNKKELVFSNLDSGYKTGTAGSKSVGRSTTVHYLHGSEVAFYQHTSEHVKGIFQAVPDVAGTEIILESTANGTGNFFHKQWQLAEAGESEYIAIFLPWFLQDEYESRVPANFNRTEYEQLLVRTYNLSDEKLAWRRNKIKEFAVTDGDDAIKSFMQEYPCNPTEAFQTTGEEGYIPNDLVLKARKLNFDGHVEAIGPKIIGIDIARFGTDRSVIITRQGRKFYDLRTYVKKSTMEMAGIIHNIILDEKPDRVFIDEGGVGAGVLDRVHELGHKKIVLGINSSSTPLNKDKFYNKRAEMWCAFKLWLEDEPCVLPDSDEMMSDICNTRRKSHSSGKLLMESKDEMKKRGVRSSDCADAGCLTFALPVSVEELKDNENMDYNASIIMHHQNTLSKLYQ